MDEEPSVEIGFEIVGAKKDTTPVEDAPTCTPMRPRTVAQQAPSTDQKKTRHRIQRSAADADFKERASKVHTFMDSIFDGRGNHAQARPHPDGGTVWSAPLHHSWVDDDTDMIHVHEKPDGSLHDLSRTSRRMANAFDTMPGYSLPPQQGDSSNLPFETPEDDEHSMSAETGYIPFEDGPVDSRDPGPPPYAASPYAPRSASLQEETSTMTTYTEADLLQAMAKAANMDEQRRLAFDLEMLRKAKREARAEEDSIDLADQYIHDTQSPVLAHVRHTASTDWLAEAEPGSGEDARSVANQMTAEASQWFQRTSAEVREDAEEFEIQAKGFARVQASRHGLHAEAAQHAFVEHALRLRRMASPGYADQSGQGVSGLPTPEDNPEVMEPLTTAPEDGALDPEAQMVFAPPMPGAVDAVPGVQNDGGHPRQGSLHEAGGYQPHLDNYWNEDGSDREPESVAMTQGDIDDWYGDDPDERAEGVAGVADHDRKQKIDYHTEQLRRLHQGARTAAEVEGADTLEDGHDALLTGAGDPYPAPDNTRFQGRRRQASPGMADPSGQGVSRLPTPEDNPEVMEPWLLGPDGKHVNGQGAADVADVPAPGEATYPGWPQPKASLTPVQAAFRDRIQAAIKAGEDA